MSAAQSPSYPWFQHLPELGDPQDFAALRALLTGSGYTVEAVCERLGVEKLETFSTPPKGGRPIQDTLDLLIALFLDCGFVDEAQLASTLIPDDLSAIRDLGLLTSDSAPAGKVYATAALLPAYGVWTVCDRGSAPDGSPCALPPDVVYPPVFDTTQRFVNELPDTPCDALLDLGTGSGIAAILGARHARHVWATDIAARSVRYADFNCRLAGLTNVTVVEGDLYEPVAGLTFDRIVTHPPYVPVKVKPTQYVFAAAGDDGEQIIRGAIEGIPRMLRPGGRFHSLQSATDREGEPFEKRLRKWLGPEQEQFDVLMAVHAVRTPLEFLAASEVRANMTLEASRAWLELWESTHTTSMVYSAVLIERHAEPMEPVTRRSKKGQGYSGRDLAAMLEWLKIGRRPNFADIFLNLRPSVAPDIEMRTVSRVQEDAFRLAEVRLEVEGPFATSLRCEEWLTKIVPRCDGKRAWRDHFDYARENDLIRGDIPASDFAQMLGVLLCIGAVKV